MLFRPERWLEANGEQSHQMERSLRLAWGHGKYSCLGKNIALMNLNKAFFEVSFSTLTGWQVDRIAYWLKCSFCEILTSRWLIRRDLGLVLTTRSGSRESCGLLSLRERICVDREYYSCARIALYLLFCYGWMFHSRFWGVLRLDVEWIHMLVQGWYLIFHSVPNILPSNTPQNHKYSISSWRVIPVVESFD